MIYAVQKMFGELYEYGCYLICLLMTAEKILNRRLNWLEKIELLIQKNLVEYHDHDDKNSNNFLVLNSQLVMDELVGKNVVKYHPEEVDYKLKSSDFVIEKYHLIGDHFVLPDYDPLGKSNTKTNGKLVQLRVFTKI